MHFYSKYIVVPLNTGLVLFEALRLESKLSLKDLIKFPQEGVIIIITFALSYWLWKLFSSFSKWPFFSGHVIEENIFSLLFMQVVHIIATKILYFVVLFMVYAILWSIFGFS